MSNDVNIVTKKTLEQKIKSFIKISLACTVAGLIVYGGVSFFDHRAYNNRFKRVQELIEQKQFLTAEEILNVYKQNSGLKPEDIIILKHKNKKEEIRTRLDSLVKNNEFSLVEKELEKIGQIRVLSIEEIEDYKTRANMKTDKGLLKLIKEAHGKQRLEYLIKFSKLHPKNFKEVADVAYTSLLESFEKNDKRYDGLVQILTSFTDYIKNDKEIGKKFDINKLYEKCSRYTEKKDKEMNQIFQLGDTVRIVKALGMLKGKDETVYWNTEERELFTHRVPLGTEGNILRYGSGNNDFRVEIKSLKDYEVFRHWFLARELENITPGKADLRDYKQIHAGDEVMIVEAKGKNGKYSNGFAIYECPLGSKGVVKHVSSSRWFRVILEGGKERAFKYQELEKINPIPVLKEQLKILDSYLKEQNVK